MKDRPSIVKYHRSSRQEFRSNRSLAFGLSIQVYFPQQSIDIVSDSKVTAVGVGYSGTEG